MKKYKPKFKFVEASRMNTKPYDWLVRFGDIIQVFSEESFNELFEEAGGCDNCVCHECDIPKCHDTRCAECDVYSLKSDRCTMEFHTSSKQTTMELEFNDSNKNHVLSILVNLQYNVYGATDTWGNPVIVVPKEGYEMWIPLNSLILVEDNVIKSYKLISREDKDGSI